MIKTNVIGIEGLKARLATASAKVKTEVNAELRGAAMEFVAGAKKDLAAQGGNKGQLLRSIAYKPDGEMAYEISANVFYAPYIEFGTKKKFDPYPGTEQFAAQYRGVKRSSPLKLIEAIRIWVADKNIGATYSVKTKRKVRQTKKEKDTIAFLIARSIYRNGISPKPFFFKQITPVRDRLMVRLKTVLNGI